MKSLTKIDHVTIFQTLSVIIWLWIIPVVDAYDNYSYGLATGGVLLKNIVFFAAGVVVASYFPKEIRRKMSVYILVLGVMMLIVAYPCIHYLREYYNYRVLPTFRFLGILCMGFGLEARDCFVKPKSTLKGVCVLLTLFTLFYLTWYMTRYIPSDAIALLAVQTAAFGILRVGISVFVWKLASIDCITHLFKQVPKLSLIVSGLFWGMFLVVPANHYAPSSLALLMLILAPVFAYVITVILRMGVMLLSYLIQGIIANRFWWMKACIWWRDETNITKIESHE